MSLKRKSASLTPSQPYIKSEDYQDVDIKRRRPDVSAGSSRIASMIVPQGLYKDPRTAALDLAEKLKRDGTVNYQIAWFHIQENSPNLDPKHVLELLKKVDKVEWNEGNEVFTYIPEPQLSTLSQIRTHIRQSSTPTKGIPMKSFRDTLAPNTLPFIEQLESNGDILIMRSLVGQYKDAPLPSLGRLNGYGMGVCEGGNGRWRSLWWDEVKERGRSGKRVEDEFVYAWADVEMRETDDVAKLLTELELSASSAAPVAAKVAGPLQKKKKRTTRALKITNTHMKDQGIDFSKDYERPA